MRISVITPTADQPMGMRLLERYMARQTIRPDEWIVADDGVEPASLTMGQTHVVRPRAAEGGASLAGNMLAALERVTGDVVIVFEHDDHYRPDHIETCLRGLARHKATGSIWQRYYNVEQRCWIVMRNIGSALCNTAFTSDLIPTMQAAAHAAIAKGSYGLDRLFWDSVATRDKLLTQTETVVGIKGLPGRKGLGMGHRPRQNGRAWSDDPSGARLAEWVGADAQFYLGVHRG
jgi:glycosyltransferase involved in cell wall biosynthesis